MDSAPTTSTEYVDSLRIDIFGWELSALALGNSTGLNTLILGQRRCDARAAGRLLQV